MIPEGGIFALFMIIVFTLRFFYEFLKENQKTWEDGNLINQGQTLSIPMVAIGIVILLLSFRKTNSLS